MKKMLSLLVLPVLMVSSSVFAHSDAGTDKNVDEIEFREVVVTENISMLQGKGGNVGLLKGSDGLLLIDDDYKVNVGALEKSLDKFEGKAAFIINTHWHGDHTGGNEHLGEYATIVAHDNVRKRLNSHQEIKFFGMKMEPSPKSALPVVTYDRSLTIHFNGESLNVVHYPNGHTDGDSIVLIQPANVVHMGDHFFAGRFPFVDLESGGDVKGMAKNIELIVGQLNAEVKVIPGHGPLSNLDDLKGYHQMLVETTKIIQAAIDQGLTLEAIQKQGLPAKWKSWGAGFIKQDTWIKTVYSSLTALK